MMLQLRASHRLALPSEEYTVPVKAACLESV